MKARLQRITVAVVVMVLLIAGLALAQGKVDINKADVKGLMSLKGIGEQKAQAIIKYRQMNGPFQSLDDLQNVPGIGAKTVANNKGMMTFSKGMSGKKGMTGREKIPAGKATAEKAKQGATKERKKAMTGATDKAKKGMTSTTGKAKKGLAGTTEKAKKSMADTSDKAKPVKQ